MSNSPNPVTRVAKEEVRTGMWKSTVLAANKEGSALNLEKTCVPAGRN